MFLYLKGVKRYLSKTTEDFCTCRILSHVSVYSPHWGIVTEKRIRVIHLYEMKDNCFFLCYYIPHHYCMAVYFKSRYYIH